MDLFCHANNVIILNECEAVSNECCDIILLYSLSSFLLQTRAKSAPATPATTTFGREPVSN